MTGTVVFAFLLVLIIVTMFAGVKAVPQGQIWTVERFGAFTRTLSPGLNFVFPYVDRVGRKLGMTRAAELESAGAALDLGAAAAYALRQIEVARRDPDQRARLERPGGLSRREVEVLRLVADGRTSGEIATQLFISPRTAEHHVQNISTKIGVSSRAAATRWAIQHQVVDGPRGA